MCDPRKGDVSKYFCHYNVISAPLHCCQVLQFILVHAVVRVVLQGFIDALQQPAALAQSHQQIILDKK